MPDIFVPEDTTGFTSYYVSVGNKGLISKYALQVADRYREVTGNVKTIEDLQRVIPRDQTLLEGFVDYAAKTECPHAGTISIRAATLFSTFSRLR